MNRRSHSLLERAIVHVSINAINSVQFFSRIAVLMKRLSCCHSSCPTTRVSASKFFWLVGATTMKPSRAFRGEYTRVLASVGNCASWHSPARILNMLSRSETSMYWPLPVRSRCTSDDWIAANADMPPKTSAVNVAVLCGLSSASSWYSTCARSKPLTAWMIGA